jgi:hypothetical protein
MARTNKLGTPYLGLPTLKRDEVKLIKRYLAVRGLSAKEYMVFLLRQSKSEMLKHIEHETTT